MSRKFSVDQWLDDVEFVDAKDHKRRRKDRSKSGELPTTTVWVSDTTWDEADEIDEEQYHRRRKTRRVRRTVEMDY